METRRPISEKKLQANRANAKRSTGPRTPAGKAAVRGNALKHGVRSSAVILPSESIEVFNEVLLRIKKAREPKTTEEERLLEEIAGLWWRLRRLGQLEGNSLSSGASDPGSSSSATLRLIRRYEGSLARQLSGRVRRLTK
jgi:hypothetical protein